MWHQAFNCKPSAQPSLLPPPVDCSALLSSLLTREVPRLQNLSQQLGVVMLRDSSPGDEDAELVDIKPPPAQAEAAEPDPPEPFEWIPN